MRNRLTLILCWLLLAALAGCSAALPGWGPVKAGPNPQTVATTQWTESTQTDFSSGALQGLEIRTAEDGELALARDADGKQTAAGTYTSIEHPVSPSFSAVAWRWNVGAPVGATVSLQIRLSVDGAQWGDWIDTRAGEDSPEGDSSLPGNLLTTPGASAVQYRVLMSGGEGVESPVLRSIEFTFIDSRPGPTVQQAMDMVQPAGTNPGVKKPAIISRAAWGANESYMTWAPEYKTPTKIIIHHTATPNDGGDPAATVRAVYYYHAVTKEWGDIAYNYLIDSLGNIYEGRFGGEGAIGGHALQFNPGSVGIAWIGDFQDASVPAAMQAATVKLVAWLCDHLNIDPRGSSYFVDRNMMNIAPHRDVNQTTCPGDKGTAWMSDLRARTWDAVQTVEPVVSFLTPGENDVLTGGITVRVRANAATTQLTLTLDGKQVSSANSNVLDWIWVTGSSTPGDHQLRAVGRNAAGQQVTATRMALVDNTAPTGTIALKDGSTTVAGRSVALSLVANDVGSGVTWMQITQGDDVFSAPLIGYQENSALELAPENGWVEISARFGDRAGLWSPVVKLVLFLDTQPPSDWTGLKAADGLASVSVSDMGSGLDLATASFATSTDGGMNWGVAKPCDTSGDEAHATLTAPAESPDRAIRFSIRDRAGNEGLSPIVFPNGPDQPPATPTPSPDATPTPEPNNGIGQPDLVVSNLELIPSSDEPNQPVLVRLTIKNESDAPAGGFWVQLYVDPSQTPVVNSISSKLGKGLFWYVPELAAGEQVILINASAYASYSTWNGELASGLHTFYAIADSYNTSGDLGLVVESDEANNTSGPAQLQVAASDSGNSWPGLAEWLRQRLSGN